MCCVLSGGGGDGGGGGGGDNCFNSCNTTLDQTFAGSSVEPEHKIQQVPFGTVAVSAYNKNNEEEIKTFNIYFNIDYITNRKTAREYRSDITYQPSPS